MSVKKAKQTRSVCLKGFGFIQLPRKTMRSIGSPEAFGKANGLGGRLSEAKNGNPV
jgi:hypothetical protein